MSPSKDALRVLECAPNKYLVLSVDLFILTASELYLEATETTRETIVGRHIFDAFPDNPNIADIEGVNNVNFSLQEVLRTKKIHQLPVIRYDVPDQNRPGAFIEKYWHASHTPVLNEDGEIEFIIQLANNVTEQVLTARALKVVEQQNSDTKALLTRVTKEMTEQVNARQETERMSNQLRLAVEAAKIGTWFIQPESKALTYNENLAVIFGYKGNAPMTYEQAIGQVTDEYRSAILNAIEEAIASGGDYDFTYQQLRFNDNELVWLRSLGRISEDEQGNHSIFSGVVIDITEQKKDEQRKNDFIGMVSHELKTPLTSLTGIIQIAGLKLKGHEDIFLGTAINRAGVLVKRMSTMINGFLNISRLESGKILIYKQRFAIDELIRGVIDETNLSSSSDVIEFDECDRLEVRADRDKIASVLSNLLSNAIKYSSKSPTIQVTCQATATEVQVSVKDDGMGIDEEDAKHIFERYYRVQSQDMKHISGFGIGLYLSAEIIERHGGRIWVESESGKGSIFAFTLPLEQKA
ncbi:ATP-binding protein [Mucilaginibacter jinjuensis]|uniref:histidine kinase n=1 Tax=Mucilaginibacter jinjuensis TaxID=1176721 RepID=A0ABY7TCI3_9SPHI|nr:ATP-binding protein [Mucilaginibacter jinjuensis]WCT13418.1 ATP-binding protein [Mucilaginibacter jinjuensis]